MRICPPALVALNSQLSPWWGDVSSEPFASRRIARHHSTLGRLRGASPYRFPLTAAPSDLSALSPQLVHLGRVVRSIIQSTSRLLGEFTFSGISVPRFSTGIVRLSNQRLISECPSAKAKPAAR